MRRFLMAIKAFWRVLKGEDLFEKPKEAPKVSEVSAKPEMKQSKGNIFDEGAVYTLVLLQREGRLIDFLQEGIDDFTDEQIGTAVRQIHKNCREVLNEHYNIQPILNKPEGGEVNFENKFDASTVKFSGSLPVSPPFQGILRHKGWKASNLHFPSRSGTVNPHVIHPAEVEIK